MTGLRLVRIIKLDQKRLTWLINLYRRVAKVPMFAKPPMKNRLVGMMVSPAICFHKSHLSLIQESRSLDRLSLFGAAKIAGLLCMILKKSG